jgi:hypothetical protein
MNGKGKKYRVLVRKLKGIDHLRSPWRRWEDNIKVYIKNGGCDLGCCKLMLVATLVVTG